MIVTHFCLFFKGLTSVSGSTVHASAHAAIYAFDGVSTTIFHSNAEFNPWLKGDLGDMHVIVGAEFTGRNSNARKHFILVVFLWNGMQNACTACKPPVACDVLSIFTSSSKL